MLPKFDLRINNVFLLGEKVLKSIIKILYMTLLSQGK